METISYGSENNGEVFVNLVPQPGSGRGARKSHGGMRGHTDGVCFPFAGTRDAVQVRMAPAPDWVCLVCLRNPHTVATRVVPVEPMLKAMPSDLRRALKEPQFVIGAQSTFIAGMKRILEASHIVDGGALLHGERGDWGFRFSHSTVDASQDATDEARAALDWVAGYCATNSEAIVLNPGDLLWVNNRRAIHGRGEVGSDVGGQERWLLRTYGIRPQLLEADQRYIARPFQLFP